MSPQHSQRVTRTTAGVVIAAAIAAAAAGPAMAAPPGSAPPPSSDNSAPGTAPGTTPAPGPGTAPGIAPAPAPAPAPPAPGRSVIPAPTYDVAPVYEDTPGYVEPTYRGTYNPVPPALQAPRPVAPVAPVLPNRLKHPGVIKLGNLRFNQGIVSDADARNLNGQAATIEARTATYYESIGFPKDQAARTAASTTVGILAGGVAGAVAVGVPAAVAGAIIGLPAGAAVGAITGAIVGAPGGPASAAALAGPGALIGLAAGPVVGGIAGAAGGAAVGALGGAALGGIIGYAVGAGDPGGNPNAPIGGATDEDPALSKPVAPNPEANQYELHLDRKGLPGNNKVDYVVAKNGDVTGQIDVGPIHAPIKISHDQADAPFKAAGVFAQTARDAVTAAAINIGRDAQRAFPGLKIAYPQYAAAPSKGKHAK